MIIVINKSGEIVTEVHQGHWWLATEANWGSAGCGGKGSYDIDGSEVPVDQWLRSQVVDPTTPGLVVIERRTDDAGSWEPVSWAYSMDAAIMYVRLQG